ALPVDVRRDDPASERHFLESLLNFLELHYIDLYFHFIELRRARRSAPPCDRPTNKFPRGCSPWTRRTRNSLSASSCLPARSRRSRKSTASRTRPCGPGWTG